MEVIVEILGWTGSCMILIAYGLNSYQKIKSNSWIFIFLNLIGGMFLIVYSFYHHAFANSFINVVWVIIAALSLVNVIRKR